MAALNFPRQSTAFIGRQNELAEIAGLLARPDCRLLTLTGPGGIGKTRLALEAAACVEFQHGAHFVPLQPLTSPDLIMSAIADALGIKFFPGANPKEQLLGFLSEKSALLVLDNLEHLLDGVSLLPEILSAAPNIRMLATSRERLNLREEWVLEVGGLNYPAKETVSDIEGYSAVDLFLQHARHSNVNFTLTAENQPAISRICRLVSGMPLGIELSAVWVRALSCEHIANEIERSLDILETPARNVEPRHRNIRGALEPSWEWLTPDERSVFSKLSVFRGGFTREAAEFVASASLRTLTALLDKSLLRMDANGRYDLHELLRQFAADKLTADETSAIAQRHLVYFLNLAEQAETHEFGSEQVPWFDRLETEMDNLQAALGWCLISGDPETGLQFAAALGWFFTERTHHSEGAYWLERMLAANPDPPVSLHAKALHTAGVLEWLVGDTQGAYRHLEQALALARATHDRWNIAWSLSHIGLYQEEDPIQGQSLLEESLVLFRELEDPMGISHTLVRLAMRACELPEYSQARPKLEEALACAQEAGDKIITAWVFYWLGTIFWLEDHNIKQAETHLNNSVSLFREARFQAWPSALMMLAGVEQAMGNEMLAQLRHEDALIMARDYNSTQHRFLSQVLVGMASLAQARLQFGRAANLLGAASNDLTQYTNPEWAVLPTYEDEVAAVRAQLGDAAFEEAWTTGNAMTREQAITYALEGRTTPISPVSAGVTDKSEKIRPNDILSVREIEILRLIADGHNSRQVAQRLYLSVGTVRWYMKQIYSKLSVHSRIQAIMRAKELNLLA